MKKFKNEERSLLFVTFCFRIHGEKNCRYLNAFCIQKPLMIVVGWMAGRFISLMFGWSVCQNFLNFLKERAGSYYSMLLLEFIKENNKEKLFF